MNCAMVHFVVIFAFRLARRQVFFSSISFFFFTNTFTQASDIEGQFINGMLVLSWPKARTPTVSQAIQVEESDVNITIPSTTPVTVKVESADMEVDSSL